jgi:hypothetical protein
VIECDEKDGHGAKALQIRSARERCRAIARGASRRFARRNHPTDDDGAHWVLGQGRREAGASDIRDAMRLEKGLGRTRATF